MNATKRHKNHTTIFVAVAQKRKLRFFLCAFCAFLWLKTSCAFLWLDAAAVAVQLRAFFDDEGRGGDLAFDLGSAAEHQFLAGENVAFDSAVDFCDRHLDYCFRDLRAGADDECS